MRGCEGVVEGPSGLACRRRGTGKSEMMRGEVMGRIWKVQLSGFDIGYDKTSSRLDNVHSHDTHSPFTLRTRAFSTISRPK
jgi:hypothetical protein